MHIAILETGTPPETLEAEHGRYDAMIAALLGETHHYTTFRAAEGDLPEKPAAFDAIVITGSPAGVHDGLGWVETLVEFLRATRGQTRLIGICFGHQVMAHAFGGSVAKAQQGWGIGLHRYHVSGNAGWLDAGATIAVPASHQDQVVVAPPGAEVIAHSDFTPHAALAYRDQPAISFQFHPEFAPGYAQALLASRPTLPITDAARAAAMESLHAPNDNARVAGWIARFLEQPVAVERVKGIEPSS